MILRYGGRRTEPLKAFGPGDLPPSRKCVCGVAENKETGGPPFAPCEIRRSTKLKNQ
jgi:hypothetical protein